MLLTNNRANLFLFRKQIWILFVYSESCWRREKNIKRKYDNNHIRWLKSHLLFVFFLQINNIILASAFNTAAFWIRAKHLSIYHNKVVNLYCRNINTAIIFFISEVKRKPHFPSTNKHLKNYISCYIFFVWHTCSGRWPHFIQYRKDLFLIADNHNM